MATYDNLPVYYESYQLLLELFRFTKDFSREYKYTLGESIKKEVVEMITNIYKANSNVSNRRVLLQTARENIEVIRLFLRLLRDLRQISLEKFAFLNLKIESVSKQLLAWQKKSYMHTGHYALARIAIC
ncbi:MAG: four helix bundle protein [Candidatus Gracilibacteria bacterium]|nr:four helix bundle protein [Candidatus Gracilibacteria bacterium]